MNAIERPDSCPKPGQIDAFDQGWNAHELGMERETVRVMAGAATPGEAGAQANRWALLAYDIRELCSKQIKVYTKEFVLTHDD